MSAEPGLRLRLDQAFSLLGRLARLGCTRIGSPGIFGEQDLKALFAAPKPQVARERNWVGYRASSCAAESRGPNHRDQRSR